LLASGSAMPHGAELLESDAFASLLQDARARYQIVLLLAPAVLQFPDATVAAHRADWNVLVVGLGVTHRHEVQEVLITIASEPSTLIGCILNS